MNITAQELEEEIKRRAIRVSGRGKFAIMHFCKSYALPMLLLQKFETEEWRMAWIRERPVPAKTFSPAAEMRPNASFRCAACRDSDRHFLLEITQ